MIIKCPQCSTDIVCNFEREDLYSGGKNAKCDNCQIVLWLYLRSFRGQHVLVKQIVGYVQNKPPPNGQAPTI